MPLLVQVSSKSDEKNINEVSAGDVLERLGELCACIGWRICRQARLESACHLLKLLFEARLVADSDGSRAAFRDDLARPSDLMWLAIPR